LLWVVFGLVNCSVPAAQEKTQTDPPAVAPEVVASLLELTLQVDGQAACRTLDMLRDQSLSGQLNGQVLRRIEQAVEPLLSVPRSDSQHTAHYASVLLLAAWGRATELQRMQSWLGDPRVPEQVQGDAVRVIVARKELPLEPVFALLCRSDTPVVLRSRILEELSRSSDDRIGSRLLELYGTLPPSLHGRVIDVLTQRPAWATLLLEAVRRGDVPKDALHAQHLLRIHAAGNAQLQQQLRELYGTIRAERNPQREAVIRQVREHLAARAGDPLRGVEVFRRLCAPCHRIYGEGNDVGPDLTRNGRASLAQLLSNVLDPNLVIGEAYQTRIVVTVDGRVITGLLVEETPQRVVLKVQGGTLESIARQDVDDMQVSPISLMPEGLEKQLSLEELADLFAFLRLDKPPTDPTARPIPDE